MGLPDPGVLAALREFFAAGFFEEPDACPMRRWSRAVRRWLEHRTPPPCDGGPLYPCGPCQSGEEDRILSPSYSCTWTYRDDAAEARMQGASAQERETLTGLRRAMRAEADRLNVLRTPHVVGGAGTTHSIPNYGRVLREGLDSYAARVAEAFGNAYFRGDAAKADFYTGLQDVLAGIRAWHASLVQAVRNFEARDAPERLNRTRLLTALEHVPFGPARDFFEALLAYNFVYYLDGCDSPGRLDQELWPYAQRDLAMGAVTRDGALALLARFLGNVEANGGWSLTLGGTAPDGSPAYNELTGLCIQAARGRARPGLQLRVRADMPDALWDAALDSLAGGSGLPALCNEEGYLKGLRRADLGLTDHDLALWSGGGCAETMIHGCSNVGSPDAGLNLPLVLVRSLDRHLADAASFDAFLEGFKRSLAATIAEVTRMVSQDQETKARWRPQPMRTLLVDDCVDRGVEFHAGGARCNWSVTHVAGLANVADSLAAVREVVFEKREKTALDLADVLRRNFEGEEAFRQRLERCPRYGNDDPRADELAADIAGFVFYGMLSQRPWRGGRFLPACIPSADGAEAGAKVGATPDGRLAGAPLAESVGPCQGRGRGGPAAMLRSVARVPQVLAVGTPLLNARFAREMFATEEGRRSVRDLIRTYFDLGGMHIQIAVVDQEASRDA